MLPPLKAIGNAKVQIFAPSAGAAKWDDAVWDSAQWVNREWRDVTPQSMQIQISWGADDPAGVLTTPAAGSWQINTYDPERKLDPSNGESDFAAALKPGRAMRIAITQEGLPDKVVRTGLIDEIDFDVAALTGSIRGTDGVSLLVNATMAETTFSDPALPDTLRARARWLINKVGLQHLIKVEADPIDGDTGLPIDPAVGPLVESAVSCWSHIGSSAFDCLNMVWLDPDATIRFRSFGSPVDNGFQLGGADGIPIATLKTQASLKGVHTRVETFDVTAPTVPVSAINDVALELYGDLPLTRDKATVDAATWVASVLADRAGASLQYLPGTIYPQTMDHLITLIDLECIEIVHLVAENLVPPVNIPARVLGGFLRADTDTGWTATIVSYIPAQEWSDAEVPPVEPPTEPPPVDTQKVQRIYNATKDTRVSKTSGGANYGSGTEGELPVGSWDGWRNRSFIDFADIPFGDVVSIDKATLELDTTDQVNVGFGSSPKITVKRVTASWSEGTASSPSGSNATVYPGPAVTSTDAVTKTITGSQNAAVSIDITLMARKWLAGNAQHGVGLFSAGEDAEKWTTEFWSRENATTSKRPRLVLDLTVEV